MPELPSELPDVLDLLGLPITEAGCAHVTVESARRYPLGQARVAVVVQSAYSGKLLVDLTVAGPEGTLATRAWSSLANCCKICPFILVNSGRQTSETRMAWQ